MRSKGLSGKMRDHPARDVRRRTLARAISPVVESVERRQHLSASIVNGVLTIVGSPTLNDNYNIYYNGSFYDVTNNNQSEGRFFTTAGINGISFDLGGGNDVVYTGAMQKPCTVWGGDGNDNIQTNNQNTVVYGGDGNDTILAANGTDTLDGGAGNDSITGGNGSDVLTGGDGNDTIIAGNGNDSLDGGAGDDWLSGDGNNDVVYGGDGDDYIKFGLGSDDINGDAGIDTYDGSVGPAGSALNVSLDNVKNDIYTLNTNDKTNIHSDIEILIGSNGNDTLTGSANADDIRGGNGNDSILGLDGNDTLDGGAGADTLRGGNGDDNITGGTGSDSMFGDDGDDTLDANDLLWIDYVDGGAGSNTVYYDLLDLLL